ncbi:MAG: hypothetical protein C5B57_08760 [Blastocatellia bacterium]|nr:MAG: hypothetical protein C5B57_08760 [Blastocatellia bacterium]
MAVPSDRSNDYERSDAAPRLLASLAGGTAAFLVLTPFILSLCYPAAAFREHVVGRIPDIPPPRLQINPAQDLARFRDNEREHLSSYGWVDRNARTAHLPVERAMSLTVERGLPGWRRP